MSQNKSLLLATFIDVKEEEIGSEKVNKFIDKLTEDYQIDKNRIFVIKNLTDVSQYILTFILDTNIGERINFNDINQGTIMIHKNKQTNTIYTINALNKLIEQECGLSKGNINYKSIEIEWEKYRNCCILLKNGELTISKTRRIFI